MITKPFMLIAGSKDILADANGNLTSNIANARLYDPVTEPYGLHDAPRYGVIIDGANHLTAVGRFNDPSWRMTSWGFAPIWNSVLSLVTAVGRLMPDERAFFDGGSFQAKLEATFNATFKNTDTTKETEEERLAKMQEYSLHFWDAYLSPRYDVVAGGGSEFLGLPIQTHLFDPFVLSDDVNIPGFVRREPVRGFVVKDNSSTPLVQFQSDGNVLISSGGFSEGQTITTSPSIAEFIVKSSSGTNLMRIDSGGLCIKGYRLKMLPVTSSQPEFVIRDVSDTGPAARIILRENGYLILKGRVYTPSGEVP
jgi:hypothetical protein